MTSCENQQYSKLGMERGTILAIRKVTRHAEDQNNLPLQPNPAHCRLLISEHYQCEYTPTAPSNQARL